MGGLLKAGRRDGGSQSKLCGKLRRASEVVERCLRFVGSVGDALGMSFGVEASLGERER